MLVEKAFLDREQDLLIPGLLIAIGIFLTKLSPFRIAQTVERQNVDLKQE